MKIKMLFAILAVLPCVGFGATRDAGNRAGIRASSFAGGAGIKAQSMNVGKVATVGANKIDTEPVTESAAETVVDEALGAEECRAAYRECMDDFCLLDESEGGRCSCSDNIKQSKSLIQEIQKIQLAAEKQYTEGVEREKLGAKAKFVGFGESEQAQKSSRRTGIDLVAWINSGTTGESLDMDEDIGDGLYDMAFESCSFVLDRCDKQKATMEEKLYQREIAKDCKAFSGYLTEQKRAAESNKRTADAAVRSATLDMLSITNKYNRGECLLAYRACIADKGGCGVNFENCLDAKLLNRRANACENVLDQCMAVKTFVLDDWKEESKMILANAAKYSDKYMRLTCNAQIRACLEDGCSINTDTGCLTNVNVAAGICPIITECDEMIPGFQSVINDKLGYLRTRFCENDVDKCLQDKCGIDFTKAECVGKKPYEIAALCPQTMFPSCKNAEHFDVIVQSAILQMDYQMLAGCVNYFSEQLGKVCGTDMACLPIVTSVESLTKLPNTDKGLTDLREKVIADSDAAVEAFFAKFEQDKTVAACADSQSGGANKKVKGKDSLGTNVFNAARLLAKMSAEQRNLRELDSKIAELTRKQGLEEAKKVCLTTYKAESPDKSKSNYTYIKSVSFEPDLRNCHVCRMQQVCEEGGESKASSALKSAAGGLAAGASAGTMINAGWGTAIGGVVGAVGAGAMGFMSGGKKDFCQEIESCEDINM